MRWVDVSNLQPALRDVWLEAMYAYGIRGVCVGLQYPGPAYPAGNAHLNLAALDRDGRFAVAAYLENTPLERVVRFVDVERLRRMPWIAVAVEQDGGFEDGASIDAALSSVDALGGPEGRIYSSPSMQATLGLEGVSYPFRKGWCADYDGDPDTPAPGFMDCRIVGKQFSMHGQIPGVPFEVDLSEIEEDEMEITKLGQTESVAAILEVVKQASPAIAQQEGRYVGEAPAPPGYRDIVFRVKED